MGGGGCCGVSANKYSFAHGAQINFGDLTPFWTYAHVRGAASWIGRGFSWDIMFNAKDQQSKTDERTSGHIAPSNHFHSQKPPSSIWLIIFVLYILQAKEYLLNDIFRGPGFLAVAYDLAPPPPLHSASSTGDTQEGWERDKTCWREMGGGGEEPYHITARKPGPLKII